MELKHIMKLGISFILLVTSTWTNPNSYFTDIESCKTNIHGMDYIGKINISESGKKCHKWTKENIENLHLNEINEEYINSVLDKNYCRNPTGFPRGPWCFIDQDTLEWEYCNIPSCCKNRNWCKDTSSGMEFIGEQNITQSGKVCKYWKDQKKFGSQLFPERNISEAKNNCRNPDNRASGPWCYVNVKNEIVESCEVPLCETGLSQIEYFGGHDFLKTLNGKVNIQRFSFIYENVSYIVTIKPQLWNSDIKMRTSLWATNYNTECVPDFEEYEYCELQKSQETNEHITLLYQCRRPFRTLLFITPLDQKSYTKKLRLGKPFTNYVKLNQAFLNYQTKIGKYLANRVKDNITIPVSNNHGHFALLTDNVIAYAVGSDNKVVMTISEVGNGRIGFLASEQYLQKNFQIHLKDYFRMIYNLHNVTPTELSKEVLEDLNSMRESGKKLSIPVIWNAHELLGEKEVFLLLNLIRYGLRITIGIKPWSYYYYKDIFEESELKPIFIAAGIWPSILISNDELSMVNNQVVSVFPLAHLLTSASSSVSEAIKLSEVISSSLINTPSEIFSQLDNFDEINENINKLFQVYLYRSKYVIPCIHNSIRENRDRAIIRLMNALLIQPFNNKFVAPGLSLYPGKIYSVNYIPETVRMKLNLKFSDEIVQLGLYISPDEESSITIITYKSEVCNLYINYHLNSMINKDIWDKWPLTQKTITLRKNKSILFSFAFGGLLSLSCKENNDIVQVIITNVHQVPMYDRRDKEANEKWNKFQKINVPWVVLAGDTVVFVVPSIAIRNLGHPDSVLILYDSMIKEALHLRGLSVSKTRRQLVSSDVQISGGYMHAGYPIGTKLQYVTNPSLTSDYLFHEDHIKANGRWGIIHEIGHNLQHELFTFTGTRDVTNNIFTLVAIESLTGIDSWTSPKSRLGTQAMRDKFKSYIINGSFSEWFKDDFLALAIYIQIKNSFGWELYAQVFRKYDILIKKINKISEEEKIQLWIRETSTHATMNLCPLYELWKWPVTNETNDYLQKFPYFMPDDFLTKEVESVVNQVIIKYGGSNIFKRKPNIIPVQVGPVKNKLLIEGHTIINNY